MFKVINKETRPTSQCEDITQSMISFQYLLLTYFTPCPSISEFQHLNVDRVVLFSVTSRIDQ